MLLLNLKITSVAKMLNINPDIVFAFERISDLCEFTSITNYALSTMCTLQIFDCVY